MRSLVVYESWFGNTQRIAERDRGGAAGGGAGRSRHGGRALPSLEDVDLLVVGAPTHIHGLSSKRSREGALDQGAHGEPGIGVRGWIDALPDGAGARARGLRHARAHVRPARRLRGPRHRPAAA